MSLQKEQLTNLGQAIIDFEKSLGEIRSLSSKIMDDDTNYFGQKMVSFMSEAQFNVMKEVIPIYSMGFIIREYLKEYDTVKDKSIDEMIAWINLKAPQTLVSAKEKQNEPGGYDPYDPDLKKMIHDNFKNLQAVVANKALKSGDDEDFSLEKVVCDATKVIAKNYNYLRW
jgi:hypothetical protein